MIGIHQIPTSKKTCCYFVRRPFGNLLLFADTLEKQNDKNDELFKSQGGIYKIILESSQNINDLHGRLFNKFGASALIDMAKDYFDERIKIERLTSYTEPQVQFLFKGPRKVIIARQDGKNVMFVGSEHYLTKDKKVKLGGSDDLEYIYKLKTDHQIDLIYFSHFEDKPVLTFKKKNLWDKFKDLAGFAD